MVNEGDTHYEVLGVLPGSTKDEIRDAYREQLTEAQADVTREETAKRPSDGAIANARQVEARVRAAWQVLSDPMQRSRYDEGHGIDNTGVALDDGSSGEEDDDDDDDGTFSEEVGDGDGGALEVAAPARGSRRVVTPTFLDGHELAQPGRRAAAAMIDVVIVTLLGGAILAIGAAVQTHSNKDTVQGIVTAAALAVLLLYFVLPTSMNGQTIGKRFTHIMVVDRDTGNIPRVSRILSRYSIPIVALLMLGFFGALLAVMAGLSFMMTKDVTSLGDKVGRTVVVVARYKPERP